MIKGSERVLPGALTGDAGERCWESCYRSLTTENNRDMMSEIYKTGNEIKRIKDIYRATNIAFLLDGTVSQQCTDDDSSFSSESWEENLRNESAASIFQLELQLMAIMTVMAGNTHAYPAAFNSVGSQACSFPSCFDCCSTFAIASMNFPPKITSGKCIDDNLEPACRASYHAMTTSPCYLATAPGLTPPSKMAVAILNSDVHSHVHKHGNYAAYSPCHTFYDHRYAIGIHNAKHDDLKRFQSKPDYHNYISDGEETRAAVQQLFDCMKSSCCLPNPTFPPPASCTYALGHTGENMTVITAPPSREGENKVTASGHTIAEEAVENSFYLFN